MTWSSRKSHIRRKPPKPYRRQRGVCVDNLGSELQVSLPSVDGRIDASVGNEVLDGWEDLLICLV